MQEFALNYSIEGSNNSFYLSNNSISTNDTSKWTWTPYAVEPWIPYEQWMPTTTITFPNTELISVKPVEKIIKIVQQHKKEKSRRMLRPIIEE
jgi:hypothetical protein